MEMLLFIPIILSFLSCIFFLPFWIKKAKQINLVWENMNSYKKEKVFAGSGGLIVLFSFLIGVLSYVAFRTFYRELDIVVIKILIITLVVFIAGFIGFIDDLIGWKAKGLSMRIRLFSVFLASIPLVVINAGEKTISLPFFGEVYLGFVYSLFLIPLGVIGVTTVYNFLAGFNGLEAGQGILILSFLSFVSYFNGMPWLSLVGIIMVFSLIGFLFFNWFPAKVLPGDILTYSVGAMIVSMAIIGNFEKIAFIVFIPFIIEMFLKIKGRIELNNGSWPYSFGKPNKDNSLSLRYKKIYSLTHFSIWFLSKIKKKVYEKDVVLFIFLLHIVFIGIAFLVMI